MNSPANNSKDVTIKFNVYISQNENGKFLQNYDNNGLNIQLYLTPDLRIKCVFSSNGGKREYISQRLRTLEAPGVIVPEGYEELRVEFTLTWNVVPGNPESRVILSSSSGVAPFGNLDGEYHVYVTDVAMPLTKIFPDINPNIGVSNDDKLFLHLIEDLDAKLVKPQATDLDYDTIKAGGLLRQLLSDDGGLITKMAKENNINLAYEVKDFSISVPDPIAKISAGFVSLDVDRYPNIARKTLNHKQFLHITSMRLGDTPISVLDVASAVANGKGGVHSKLKNGKDTWKKLLDSDKDIFVGGTDTSLRALFSIGRVTLKAAEPIVNAIVARSKANNGQ